MADRKKKDTKAPEKVVAAPKSETSETETPKPAVLKPETSSPASPKKKIGAGVGGYTGKCGKK